MNDGVMIMYKINIFLFLHPEYLSAFVRCNPETVTFHKLKMCFIMQVFVAEIVWMVLKFN